MPAPLPTRGSRAHRRAIERRMALMAAHGRRREEMAEEFGVDPSTIFRTLNKPHVADLVEQFMVQSEAKLEELLAQGEKRAAETLVELLADPDSDVRLKAAIRLTDMAGRAGKPVDRIQTQSLSLTGDAAQAALVQAVRDPGVRAWLSQNPLADHSLRALLPGPSDAREPVGPA